MVASLVLLLPAFSQQARRERVTFEPYTLTTYDGQSHPAELGRLRVPENRRGKSHRLIQIAFVRLKSSERLVQTESEARTSLFGDVSRIDMQPEICKEALGSFSLGPEYFAPLYSTVPVLFLSGTFDADTPPMKAERMRWGFSHSTHIVVENGFHETLPAERVQAAVADFLKGEDVHDRNIVLQAPHFLSLDEAKHSQGPPR